MSLLLWTNCETRCSIRWGFASAATFIFMLSGCGHRTDSLFIGPDEPVVERHSLKQLRDRYVVKQALDYSCGAAALATLLIYYYGDLTSEAEILASLKEHLSPEELAIKAERGFSLLDLKQAAQRRGFRAAGFRLTPDQLTRLRAPVIVYVEPKGYKHFAVLRAVRNGMVYLADPARGNLRMRIDQFAGPGNEWQGGIIFVLGRTGEHQITAYAAAPVIPFSDLQPQLIDVFDLLDQGAALRTLPLR